MISNVVMLTPEKAAELGLKDGVETEVTLKGMAHVWDGGAMIQVDAGPVAIGETEDVGKGKKGGKAKMSGRAMAALGAGKDMM